jgi:hypothetical protein
MKQFLYAVAFLCLAGAPTAQAQRAIARPAASPVKMPAPTPSSTPRDHKPGGLPKSLAA